MRYRDWDIRLNEFLMRPRSFDWVECNCAMFAADAIVALTGHDFAAPFRGLKSKRAVIAKLRSVVNSPEMPIGDALQALATQCLGDGINPRLAQRGDIVAADVGNGVALGVCAGKYGLFLAKSGYVKIPLSNCIKAWRVK